VSNWFLRAEELPDGRWTFRFGGREFGTLPDRRSALRQLVSAASALGGRDMFDFHLYGLDGSVEILHAKDSVLCE
jgi:hypothetical protein